MVRPKQNRTVIPLGSGRKRRQRCSSAPQVSLGEPERNHNDTLHIGEPNKQQQKAQQHKHDTVELWMTDDAAALNQVSQLTVTRYYHDNNPPRLSSFSSFSWRQFKQQPGV